MRQQLQQLTSREISQRDWSVSGFKKDLNIYEERLPVIEKQPRPVTVVSEDYNYESFTRETS